MPVQYTSILAEHRHTRMTASIFDCSHMGQFRLREPDVATELDTLLPRRASKQAIGTCRYNFLLTTDGTVIDDIIVYRLAATVFYIDVNAGTVAGDADQFRKYLSRTSEFIDEPADTAKLDIQGPASRDILTATGVTTAADLRYFRFCETELDGVRCILSRTGYTGELGFKIYVASSAAAAIGERLLRNESLQPAGLGARDTLRLEIGYPLYGHELDREKLR